MVASLDGLSDVVESKLHGAPLYCNSYTAPLSYREAYWTLSISGRS